MLFEALAIVRASSRRFAWSALETAAYAESLERWLVILRWRQRSFRRLPKNMCDWLALADVSVLPSFYEGLPLAAIESHAAGKPVVATRVDGTPEVVIDGKTGLTVPPGNPELLAEAICRLLHNRELARTFGRAGRQWVMEHFSQERQIRETEELYMRRISNDPRRAHPLPRFRRSARKRRSCANRICHGADVSPERRHPDDRCAASGVQTSSASIPPSAAWRNSAHVFEPSC